MEDGSSKINTDLYLPEGMTEKDLTLEKLLTTVKIKSQEASSQVLQIQILIRNQWVNLANIDLKNHEVNFEYPYYLKFKDFDKDTLALFCFKNKLVKLRSPRTQKVSKVKKESGIEAQKVGALFEQVCTLKLNKPSSFRDKFVLKILQDHNLNPETTQVSFLHQGEQMVATIDDGKVLPKSDILVSLNNLKTNENIKLGVSAKKTNLLTQVHITSVDSLKNTLKIKYKITMPKLVESALKKFAGVDGYTPRETLNPVEIKQLVQADRNRFLLQELQPKEQQALKEWISENLEVLLKLSIAEGSVKDSSYHAKYLIVNENPYCQSSDWKPQIQSIQEVIEKAKIEGVSFSETGGAIKLGSKITIQMKGSGSQTQRSCLQFKKSL